MGPIWNPVALPIWVPYRLLAGDEDHQNVGLDLGPGCLTL